MGMYDYIDFETTCPKCGELIKDFQSKDSACIMNTLKFWEVDNFYSSCANCGTWVEYSLKERKKRNLSEYEKLVRMSKNNNKKIIEGKIIISKKVSNEKHKCKNCRELCYGTICMKCFKKNRRTGQLSRLRSIKGGSK